MPDGAERTPAGRFIGRTRERAELSALMAAARLVTVVGPGGSGKTRLAREVVDTLSDDLKDGAVFVDLSVVEAPGMVANAVAEAMGLRDEAASRPDEALDAFVAGKTMLLVLDNCEHLAAACGQLASRLLQAGDQLRVLATSREPLRTPGEVTWRISPLSVPRPGADMAAIGASESAQLFCDRAREVLPGFELSLANADAVALLCRELDGIPLALELAAARTRDLPVTELAERVGAALQELASGPEGAGGRHRTLRATIDWSYELLTPDEQVLCRRLSVFVGGWTAESAADVCGFAPLSGEGISALISALVDRSIAVGSPGTARYRLLETVRQYGAEKLAESGETEAIRDHHLAWAAVLARRWGPEMTMALASEAAERILAEESNIGAALNWSVGNESGQSTLGA